MRHPCAVYKDLDDCKAKILPQQRRYGFHNTEAQTLYHCNCTARCITTTDSLLNFLSSLWKEVHIVCFALFVFVCLYLFKIRPKTADAVLCFVTPKLGHTHCTEHLNLESHCYIRCKQFAEFARKSCLGLGHCHPLMFAHVGSLWLHCASTLLLWSSTVMPPAIATLTSTFTPLWL